MSILLVVDGSFVGLACCAGLEMGGTGMLQKSALSRNSMLHACSTR